MNTDNEIDKVSNWQKANKPTLNINKTNYIILKPIQKKSSTADLNIKIKNQLIDKKNNNNKTLKSSVYLLMLSLNWKEHIRIISKKSQDPMELYQITLRTLFSNFIYLYYSSAIWRCNYQANLAKVIILQKRVRRTITKPEYDANISPIFYNFKHLNLNQTHNLQA